MYIISLNYIKPIEEVEKYITAHRIYLDKYYDSKVFICSGRKNPRTGGIILANNIDRLRLEEIIAEDPFAKAEAAEYEIIEFEPTKYVDEMKNIINNSI